MTYSDKIREIRKSKKMNLRNFGKLVDCSFTHIGTLERGFDLHTGKATDPKISLIKRICERTGYDFRTFLEETGYLSHVSSESSAASEIQTIFDQLSESRQHLVLAYARDVLLREQEEQEEQSQIPAEIQRQIRTEK